LTQPQDTEFTGLFGMSTSNRQPASTSITARQTGIAARGGRGEIVNRSGLARIMGVTPQTIDNWLARGWLARGCPFAARPEGGNRAWQFDTAAVINWRVSEAVRAALSGRKNGK